MTDTPRTLPDGMGRKTPRRVPRLGTDPMAAPPRPIPDHNIMDDPQLLSETLGTMRGVRRQMKEEGRKVDVRLDLRSTGEPDPNRLEYM